MNQKYESSDEEVKEFCTGKLYDAINIKQRSVIFAINYFHDLFSR